MLTGLLEAFRSRRTPVRSGTRSGNKADLVLILCHCHIVSDRCVKAAVDDGALSVDDVGTACAAGTHCGGCRPTIAALLASLLAGEQDQPAA